MIQTIEEAIAHIARKREGQIVHASSRTLTDLRVDRLILGPGTKEDLDWYLVGWPKGAAYVLMSAWPDLSVLSQGEALFLPAQKEAIHRGGLQGLADVVSRLMEPESGCPWDLEQTHFTLKKYLIEEAYELIEAIDREDREGMMEELGDVLLQPMMHAEISRRRGVFDLQQVAQEEAEKLVRRHPHVFGDKIANTADEVLANWDNVKRAEKERTSILEGIPTAMPQLLRALETSKRAARAGFEWPNLSGVFEKLHEELAELHEAIEGGDRKAQGGELGDLLFTVVNVARWLKIDPEEALRLMLTRFTARFRVMEQSSDKPLHELSPERWDELWEQAKLWSAASPDAAF
ncbi:MAG: nucleoside triphosphate pyrophosphohydrolase [Fimbriimonadaceae bacterium]|nr:nucleoside triphosphate pyrophosphohydrolase [Fimbriimonadaceae bacterium]